MKVLALHGAGGSPSEWEKVVAELDGEHEIVPLPLEGPWEWESVLDRIEPHADGNPVVLGMSLGGMVAALWGRRHPECPAVIDIDGHGVPTQPRRHVDPDLAAIAGLREMFLAYGEPELQQAMEELDCFEVFRDVRCPMLLAVATKPMPGQLLFGSYQAGLARDLPTLPPNITVERFDDSHAVLATNPHLVAALVRDFLQAR
ncbi:alpha/beta hydrolase [Amycolatopsis cynarae]|uniref:Alpha/beta hydrolase n=1 Tax=Amycolatopsis cynarae TaxID=2995223 RepID=A0ABY7BCF9_9PSEU|nr:alpha/beta hydrolase [Amycolatopsis sp. HUAS 11-8]WAL68581.1 alpha/beta hydrolase [Amycolatopsis sp. HUAS 11-8]